MSEKEKIPQPESQKTDFRHLEEEMAALGLGCCGRPAGPVCCGKHHHGAVSPVEPVQAEE